jgi:hypothetical protein
MLRKKKKATPNTEVLQHLFLEITCQTAINESRISKAGKKMNIKFAANSLLSL